MLARQVDGLVKRAEDFYSNNSTYLADAVKHQSDYHAKNLQHFKDARDAYLQQAKDAGGCHPHFQTGTRSYFDPDHATAFKRFTTIIYSVHHRLMLSLESVRAVNFLKKEGVSGATKAAVDSLLATVEQAKAVPSYLSEQANVLLQKVSVAWEKLAEIPAGAVAVTQHIC